MNTSIERGLRRLMLLALLVSVSLPLSAQAYTYSVLIDSDNDAATGCTVATPNGAMAGVDARLDAQISFEPLLVQTQQLSLCESGSFGTPQSLPAGHPVGTDRGPGPTDVVELGVATALLGNALSTDWNLSFLASSPLLGAADAAGPVLATGLGVPALPPPVPRPVIVPAVGVWSLMALCLALGLAAAWTLRRHPGLMLGALMIGALSSAGIAWAAGYVLDGEINDWNVPPLLVDPAGDTTQPEPQVDLRGVYAARDGDTVFFRFDVTEMRLPVLVPPFLNTSFSVNENAPNNTLVGSINAAPGGLSTLLRFTLSAQAPSAGFSVDNATGEIRVADSSQLDFETRPSFTLDVVVTLQGAAGFSLDRQVTVTLNDLNEVPQIADQAFSVFENAVNGEVVGTVIASDTDAGVNGQLSYSVIGGSGQGVFAINTGSGQITVANAAAMNIASSPYSLQVQVSDGGSPSLSASATMTITLTDVNDAPSFTPGPSPVTVLEDSAAYSAAWATAINDGDGGTQTLSFEFTANSNASLFAVAPAISPSGVLSFTLAADANGSADLSVRLRDNGGTANGGIDVSPVASFVITATPVNDAPSFVIPATAPPVLEGAGPQTVAGFATAISAGPPDEAGQALSFTSTVTATTGNLAFASAPALAANGTLSYAPQAGTSGTATVSVVLSDNGGTANGGVDTSAPQTFTIQVSNVNDAPSFTPGPSPVAVLEDSGAYSAVWATDLNDNDGGIQALSFVVLSNSNPSLFATAPALSPTGVLSFAPAADANGSATLSVALRDDGGTANGGVDQSAPVELVLNVTAVNDAPSFTIPAAANPVFQDDGATVQAGFATAISAGPADESGQTLSFALSLTGSTGNLAFAQAPAIDPITGNLSFAAQNGTSGVATISVVLSDNGGTANGGVDTSPPQVFTLEVVNVNDAPSFTPGPSPLVVLEDSGAYSATWATDINDNDGGTQVVNFELTAGATTGNLTFSVAPSISPTGVLSFTPAPDSNGSASYSVVLRDNGGTAFGGVDASAPVPLVIEVTAANDAPSFTIPATAPSVLENAGPQSVPGFASGISPGPVDEAGQTLSFTLSVTGVTGGLLFSAPPAIDPTTGTLTYEASADRSGVATISVVLSDNGGTANGGVDTSAPQVFTLEVLFVNSEPTFVEGGNVVVDEDSGLYSAGWATAIDDGDPGVSQGLTFVVLGNDNPALFATLPGINASTGNLSFLPAPDANGVANLSVVLRDDGGTANGGVDTSAAVNFSITVNPVNDPPVVVPPTSVAVHRHIGIAIASANAANLLANVSDVDGPGGAPFSVTVQTNAATAQGGRVSIAADGSWSYTPPASETATADSFSFQVCDSGVPAPPACTTATATLALSGEAVWFVNDDAPAGGDGTLARPFQTLSAAVTAASVNTKIFKFSGSYIGGVTLKNGQQLIGQGTSGAFDTVLGIAPPTQAVARPSLGGARPQLSTSIAATHAITLGSGNTVRGIEIGNTTGAALLGANVGALSLGENRIVGGGQALDLANGTVTEVGGNAFTEVSSSSGAQNVRLSAIAGTLNLGSGALNGATGTAFQFSTGTATVNYAGAIGKASAGRLIDIEGAASANLNLSGNLTCSNLCGSGAGNQGLRVSGRTGGTISFSGAIKEFVGTSINPAVQLLNNTGANIALSGITILGSGTTPLVGSALVASGGGTLSVNGELSIVTSAARSLQLSGMTLSGNMTGVMNSEGALGAGTPAIDIQSSNSPAGVTFGQQLIIDHDDAGESGGGINLVGNTGSFSFSNVARVVSINTTALRASNAGTLVVGNVAAGDLVNNGGIAIDVQNTTIGAAGINAVSVQSLGGAHGILLNNTGSSGALTVTGNGGTCTSSANCTGGFIANTSSHGIQLTNTVAPSITRMRIQNTGGSGIQGTEVNGFTFANGSIDSTGTAGGVNTANIAFNTSAAGTERNVYGAVSITNSSLSNSRYHGVELFNFNGTLSSVNISGNTLTSSTSAATSQGWGIGLIAFGSASTVANVTAANITNNVITNFPGGGGIQVQGGNANAAGSAGLMGTAGSPTNIINITGNRIAGASPANRIGGEGIVALVNGRGQGNFNISNNGTVANPITNVTGIGISNSAFGLANVTSLIESNVIVANNSFAAQGIGGGLGNTFGVTDTPQMTMTVRGNTISQVDGNGILLVSRDTSGTLRARVQNNTVAAPLTGVRPGIRIDSGNAANGDNDTVCLDLSGNTSAGSGGSPGLGLRKQGTDPNQFRFGVVGMTATGSPGVETYVNGLNPAGGGTLLISATSGFSNCSIP
ncbi:MAG: Ig-like domain-containing protein [Aquimonas sp.]|nr:Ig-like domain-containing protein [Aquimonas sp.]